MAKEYALRGWVRKRGVRGFVWLSISIDRESPKFGLTGDSRVTAALFHFPYVDAKGGQLDLACAGWIA